MTVTHHHLGIVARDPVRSVSFYVHVLGGSASPLPGHAVAVRAGDICLAIVARREGDPEELPWGHHLALRIAARERAPLLARLAKVGAPHEEVDGRIYARDPDGFTLEFLPERSEP